MNAISFRDRTFSLKDNETVLDGLLREGYEVTYGCRAGVCQSCVMVCDEGEIPLVAQNGLKDSQKELGHFLACQCQPSSTIRISSTDQEAAIQPAKVVEKSWLGGQVIRLRMEVEMSFRAGQYVTLWRDSLLGRCYSIASLAEEGYIECHIKVIDNGQFSQWVKSDLKEGQTIGVQGPMGTCFYQGALEQDLLLASIGTGLSPIYGILKDALSKGHLGQIKLIVGARQVQGFYMQDLIRNLAEKHDNLEVYFLAQETGDHREHDIVCGSIYDFCNERFKSLSNTKVFLCGAESFVKKMRRQCFMSGANMADIYADSFMASGSS